MQVSFQSSKIRRKQGIIGPAHRSFSLYGFTLVELLVVIAVIALLMAILLPALSKAREQGKRAVCLTHIKQLQLAWNMYCDSNNEKVPVGDVWFSWEPGFNPPQLAWHEWPHSFPHSMPPTALTNHPPRTAGAPFGYDCVRTGQCDKQDLWYHAIAEGTLWKYVKDYKIYQCPVGEKGEFVTYAMSHSMNTYPNSGGTPAVKAPTITLRNQIKSTFDRFVFLDAGFAKQGAFFVNYSDAAANATWYDMAMRHGQGTNFSFVDGHAEYKKWTDPHFFTSYQAGYGNGGRDTCDCDIRWLTKVTWGDVPYNCTNPNIHCDE